MARAEADSASDVRRVRTCLLELEGVVIGVRRLIDPMGDGFEPACARCLYTYVCYASRVRVRSSEGVVVDSRVWSVEGLGGQAARPHTDIRG